MGDWDADREQFVPQSHGRMNWRRQEQSLYTALDRDYFAPESVLAPDGRRVMWAWLRSMPGEIAERSIQSLPRELSLGADGALRMNPLRELESLRYAPLILSNVTVESADSYEAMLAGPALTELDGDAYEIRITVDQAEARRKRFGIQLFADEANEGLPILLLPEYSKLRVGSTEAPFSVSELDEGEDLVLRIFIDKYLVEVFVNDRQAVVASYMNYQSASKVRGYSFHESTTFRTVEIWRLRLTNQGFYEARESRIWDVDTDS